MNSEQHLVRRPALGETAALASLYELHAPAAYAVALHLTGDVGRARRAVNESFLGLWLQPADFQEKVGSQLQRHVLSAARPPGLDWS